MRKSGRPCLLLKGTLSQQNLSQPRQTCLLAEYWQAVLTLGHLFLPLCLSLLSHSSLHHSLSYNSTFVCGTLGILAKKQRSSVADVEAEVTPRYHGNAQHTHIHCMASLWQSEVGRNNTGCAWPRGHHANPRTVAKGKHTKIHSRAIRKWLEEQHTAINHAGESQLHSHVSTMHKLASAKKKKKRPITN